MIIIDPELDALKQRILIIEWNNLPPKDFITFFTQYASDSLVRTALWYLIDEGKLELGPKLEIRKNNGNNY